MNKKPIIIIFAFFATCFLLEFASFLLLQTKFFRLHNPDRTIDKMESFKNRMDLDPFYKEMFCDFIHKTEKGHRLSADLIMENISFNRSSTVWFFGGSTTEGLNCNNIQKTFVDFISEMSPKNVFKNFGKTSMNSDYSITKLKKNLTSGKKVNYIVWGHWINEFLVHGDKRDLNFNKLRLQFDLGKNSKLDDITKMLQRLRLTLYQRSFFFRMLINSIQNLQSKTSILSFSAQQVEDEGLDEINIFFKKAFKGDVKLFSKYSLKNYSLNLLELYQLSVQYDFKVIILYMPHIKDIYKKRRPTLNTFLEEWYRDIKDLLMKQSTEYNWSFIDLDKAFLITK